MTIKDAVEKAHAALLGITVPAAHLRDIGFPVQEAIDLLAACVDACQRAEQEEKGGDE